MTAVAAQDALQLLKPFDTVGQVIQVGLDGGFCASEPAGDLADRETLFVAVAAGERRSSPPLQYTPLDGHPPVTSAPCTTPVDDPPRR